MGILNKVTLTVSDVTGWDIEDVAALTGWLNAYANLLGDNEEDKVINSVRTALAIEGKFPTTDINNWFRATLCLIFYDLMILISQNSEVKDSNFKRLQQQFSPLIYRASSTFNNCFDEIDFEQNRDSILRQAERLMQKV